MVNILGGPAEGTLQDRYPAALAAHPEAKFHGYGKEPRPGRKVGHVTVDRRRPRRRGVPGPGGRGVLRRLIAPSGACRSRVPAAGLRPYH